MTPTTRKSAIAIAAAATILPVAVAAVAYPDRTRRLGHGLSDRLNHAIGTTPADLEEQAKDQARTIMARLDGLSHDLQVRAGLASDRPSTGSMVAAGILAAIAIPAALTAWFAPDRLRQARDYVAGGSTDPEQTLKDLSARLDALNTSIERQRDTAFDSVAQAAAHRNG